MIIDVVLGLIIRFVILSIPLPYSVRIFGVFLVVSGTVVWLRGVGFEFLNSHFWNERNRRFCY